MDEGFVINLELKGSVDVVKTFRRLKELQKKDIVFNHFTKKTVFQLRITAGFYETLEEFVDLVQAIVSKDKDGIINHVKKVFPKYAGKDALYPALFDIYFSSHSLGISFTDEEENVMYNCLKKPDTK